MFDGYKLFFLRNAMGDRRDKALKELREQLATLNQQNVYVKKERQNIFETSGFKIVASMSMLALVLFSKW
ncbi:hypothetical protein LIER_04219 [Lithospermum erythrorhizon]|uniref:Uncharacterized protein n=1 Tax=Lithospermum erythrorhizon TaxID=34254 RepID=A0AAV3NXB7_LITER